MLKYIRTLVSYFKVTCRQFKIAFVIYDVCQIKFSLLNFTFKKPKLCLDLAVAALLISDSLEFKDLVE